MTNLGEQITRNSSLQTYLVILLLVDKELKSAAYDAYAYFRWLDDEIDDKTRDAESCRHLIERERKVILAGYESKKMENLTPEENLITQVIRADSRRDGKLAKFIDNFMAIIEFDCNRKNRLISEAELGWYTKTLSVAVTSGIEYFINNDYRYPDDKYHYSAAGAAHILHMLRDYREDLEEGYLNIPHEYLAKHHIEPSMITHELFKKWVRSRIGQARKELRKGKSYIKKLTVLRGKLAAYWYCERFTICMNQIIMDRYALRPSYPKQSKLQRYWKMIKVGFQTVGEHCRMSY